MYVSLNWLREFVDLPKNVDHSAIAELLTIRTAEVDRVIDKSKDLDGIVVGKVLEVSKHPDADKLWVVQAATGTTVTTQVVCGGVNLKKGMLVALALPGSRVLWHGQEAAEIKVASVRGVESRGMICASEEIGLGECAGKEIMDISNLKAKPGTPLAKALGLDDVVFEFDNKSLTHRPDLWGHLGIAREIAAITGNAFKENKAKIKIPTSGKVPMVTVKNPELCPRYMAMIIKDVKVGESPDWLKKRLSAVGHSIINNIVDVTNYVMEEVGQPLHAFDLKNIEGGIVVRAAKKGEKIVTLDGEEKQLDASALVIADGKKPLAIAGVMGGQHSGIAEYTVDILIESANFEPSSVRQTSLKTGLRTDSVQRFEKSLDPKLCKRALLRAAELILQLCPDSYMAGPYADVANFETYEPEIDIDADIINQKIGVKIPTAEMKEILESLGFEVKNKTVKVPSYRATIDVDIEDDIVEEIARMHGYEKIPALLPDLPARVPDENVERKNEHELKEIFAHALSFNEVYNYSFYSEKTVQTFGLPEDKHLKLKNTLSEEQSRLRMTLMPNLLESLSEAAKYEDKPSLFELGRVYSAAAGKFMPDEKQMLAAAAIFDKTENAFGAMKGKLEEFFELYGIENAIFAQNGNPANYEHPRQSALIKYRGKTLGHIFTLHPAFDFKGRVVCFELDFSALSTGRKTNRKYKAESKFPSIDFDVSVHFEKRVSVAEITDAIVKSQSKNLKKIDLFDTYEKSLAFRITLQSEERTLSGADLEISQKAVWAALEKLGGKIRGKK